MGLLLTIRDQKSLLLPCPPLSKQTVKRYLPQLETLPKESSALIGKDSTESRHGRGGYLPPGDNGLTKATPPMERRAPAEILPIKKIA